MPNKHLAGGGRLAQSKQALVLTHSKKTNFASIIFPKTTSTKSKVWGCTDMIIRLMGFKFYWQKPVLDFANYFSQPTQNIFETLKKCKKNIVHRTFFAIKSDWFHTRKLKYDLTKQHSFNFQCFGMTIQTKRQFVNY